MNAHERMKTVLSGDTPDRPAYALWQHFPGSDRSPERLARATIDFARTWKPDLLKHTPNGMYAVEDWAAGLDAVPIEVNEQEGVPYSLNLSVDWRRLSRLDVRSGALGRELLSLRLVCDAIGRDVPVFMTVFGPLTLAAKICGMRIVDNIRQAPDDLHEGLRTITDTMVAFMRAVREAGADGVYFATQFASHDLVSEDEYAVFGEPYDLEVLEAWGDAGPVILHLCGPNIFFGLSNSYPVQAVCWDHGISSPTFRDAFAMTNCTIVAGMQERTFPLSSQGVFEQASDALAVSKGVRHILAPTCVIPSDAPDESLVAVLKAVQSA